MHARLKWLASAALTVAAGPAFSHHSNSAYKVDQIITLNTSTPMITQIQKMVMCRSNTERLTSVAPRCMLTSQAPWADE